MKPNIVYIFYHPFFFINLSPLKKINILVVHVLNIITNILLRNAVDQMEAYLTEIDIAKNIP